MYKIIGANQVEYGPITGDQLREWIREGRVNGQTPAQMEGETTWKPLSMFPEFASALPAMAPQVFGQGTPVADEGGRQRAIQLVNAPSICLIITAALGLAYGLLSVVLALAGFTAGNMQSFNIPGQNQEFARLMQNSNSGVGIIYQVVCLLGCGFILFGAIKMRKLESHGLCIAAAIIAMIPCLTPCPCCLLGIPFGIWALMVLSKGEVKEFFT